jgi:hypothetical protein
MRKNYVHESQYFYGNKISDYGLEHGYVDYKTLAKSFDLVLNNNIINYEDNYNNWELINGLDYDEEYDEYTEVFQYYIISDNGADILQELTDEIVYYNEKLDMYLWGITHYGTAWDYVLTDIKIKLDDDKC